MRELGEKFVEVENRVKAMAAENRSLKARVGELEQELVQARRAARDFEHIHGKHLHVREKIERVLQSLETVREKE